MTPHSREFVALMQSMKTGALLRSRVEAGAHLAAPTPRSARRSAAMARRSAPPFRSPTTFSTPRATNRLWASAPARTPTATRRRWSPRSGLEEARKRRDALAQEAIQALDDGGFGDAGGDPRGGRAFHRRAKVLIMPQSGGKRRPAPPKPLRIMSGRGRACCSADCSGLRSGFVLPGEWRGVTRGLVGWNVAIWTYLVAAGVMIVRSENRDIHRRRRFAGRGPLRDSRPRGALA